MDGVRASGHREAINQILHISIDIFLGTESSSF